MRVRLRVAQAAALDPDADPLTRIRQGTEASVRFMAQHRAFFALLEVEQRPDGLAGLLREGTDVHTADTALLVKEAQAAGQGPEDRDPQLHALGGVGPRGPFTPFPRRGRNGKDRDDPPPLLGRWVPAPVPGWPPLRFTPV